MEPLFLVVDLFCGAGGTTCGFAQAELEGHGIAKVIACVNHDPIAIESHWKNHPEVKHFEEDIRTLDLTQLVKITKHYQEKFPNALLILWASLECTNFSKAKGGQPRDADSRTLADHLERYIEALQPDYVQIENVVEFMSWGPLDENGKPVSRKNGSDWMRWRKEICDMGYVDDWKELNSANFGAYTSRNRLFGCFARPWLPIIFPEPTHAKNPSKFSMHGDLEKWKAVKEVLNFSDEGESIFNRKKPLSDKTLERIFAGLVKYVAKGDKAFISKYFSGRPKGKVNSVNDPSSTITTFGGSTLVQTKTFSDVSIERPIGTITTVDHHALVQPNFLVKYNSCDKDGNYHPPSLDSPAPVITTQNRLYLAQAKFLTLHYSSGGQLASVDNPCPTLSTKDRVSVVQPEYFIDKHFGVAQNQSIEDPAGTIMPNDKHRLVQADSFIMPTNFDNKPKSVEEPAPTLTASRRHHYIVNPSHGGHSTSTDAPCPVIVARQDKAPLYLVQAENGPVAVAVFDTDSEPMIRIKQFMAMYNLVDIKMRMLRVHELLRIQGFPNDYKLSGNQSDQKKFIGNSVVPQVVKAWTEALAMRIVDTRKKEVA
jgi:DNA (cytosine-5)-methyltransferase 1